MDNGFLLDELLALRNDSWETYFPMEINDLYNNSWNYEYFAENPIPIPLPCTTTTTTTSSFEDYSNFPFDQSLNSPLISEFYSTQLLGDELSPLELTNSSNNWLDTPFTSQLQDLEVGNFNIGSLCPEKKVNTKKLNGQPSKNLMAERRRRKRLNERLSMLRSIVPKISKMDRTSIVGDTINYTKELLAKINNLQEEMELGPNQLSLMSIFMNEKPIEMFVRNSPKFDVERRSIDTRLEITCAGKSDLLLSTLTTLDALGLETQQCVISCFTDFAMQASCSELLPLLISIFSRAEDLSKMISPPFQDRGNGAERIYKCRRDKAGTIQKCWICRKMSLVLTKFGGK
ncbi:PREDICTED: transcription factor bHLH61-like isoform X1 [Nicotiana attenuata]|uniref:transcription factor bHLH61-like isoform X1 n=1 Tax=Nicotiana attenuata TaxID=49451 RepID=UPI000904D256|nr:PREDICTED: transcription factor bHLH61-like isoform X1 [Nicotiana attenuata]